MIFYNLTSYLAAKDEWGNMESTVINGVGFVKVNGLWKSAKEVPAPRYEYPCDEGNPDKRKIRTGIKPEKMNKKYSKETV